MMKGFLEYVPGDSFLHRMNPVAKLGAALLLVVATFATGNFVLLALLAVLDVMLAAQCKMLPQTLGLARAVALFSLLLALIAFGRETHFLRLTLLTVAIACALAGTVLALGLLAGQHIPNARGIFYTNVNGKTLLLSASGVYLLLTVIFRTAAAHGIRGECLPVTVCLLGQTVALTALLDTGNSLRDTAGEPVLTAELSRFPQLAAVIQHRSSAEALPILRQRFPKLRPQLLPVRTAAGGGLLVSVSSDWTEIGGVRYPNLRIALTDTELGGGYTALWGGEGRRKHERMAAAAAVPSGIVPGAGAALYRRQRYASTAAEPGARDGAAEPIGRGGGPAGADRA